MSFQSFGLLLSVFLVAGVFLPVHGAAGSRDYIIDTWSGDNGLPNSSVTAIAQTSDGYLWIGTHNGLARFDGVRFTTFDPFNTPELKQARIRGLFMDGRGTLWINTYDNSLTSWRNGVFKYEFHAQQVAAVFSTSNRTFFAMQGGDLFSRSGGADEPGQWSSIRHVGKTTGESFHADAQGNLWFVTRDGTLGRVNLESTNSEVISGGTELAGKRVMCVASDVAGKIWIGTDKGIASWDGRQFHDETPTNGEAPVSISFLFCSNDGGCWALANNRMKKCVNRQWISETEPWGGFLGAYAGAFGAFRDRTGGTWFRHFGQGLLHVRSDGTTHRISEEDGMPGDRVTSWFEDHEGNIWAGVDRGGLVRLREKRFQVLGSAEGIGSSGAVSVCEDSEGAIWIGTYGAGLNRWFREQLDSYMLPEGATKGFFFSAYPDRNGRLWLSAGREDLYSFEQGKISAGPTAVHGVKATLVDRSGRAWIGLKDGIFCITDGQVQNLSSAVQGTGIHALAEDKQGNIWAGGENGTLYQFSAGGVVSERPNDSLAQQSIWSLLVDDDGTLWAGTFRGGLLRFKEHKFTRYTTQAGLPNDVICQLLDDGAGKLWVGSHHGIFQVAKSALDAYALGQQSTVTCLSYGLYDGLPTLECSGSYQPSAWRAHDGRLWFATFKGVVSIQPGDQPRNELPPPVAIEEIRVDGKGTTILPQAGRPDGGEDQTLRVSPGRHYFELRYTALSFVAPEKIRFRHKLEGLESDWIETVNVREVNYTQLAPGTYRFRVTACNSDGVWNDQGTSFAFVVLPSFWQTWWFRVLIWTVVFGTLSGLVWFFATRHLHRNLEQLRQQQAIDRDRERIAKDIHDDLGAGLTQIMLQSAIAKNDSAEQMRVHLTQISHNAHQLVRDMDETIWAINPENDSLEGVISYMGKFVLDYVTAAQLRCRLDLPTQVPSIPVAAEVRHNLFLAVKEALNNIIKHAKATEVFFQFQLEKEEFTFVIRDNGSGFASGSGVVQKPSEGRISSGHGTKNLVDRMEKIGGRCVIQSEVGKGTEVRLTVMIQNSSV